MRRLPHLFVLALGLLAWAAAGAGAQERGSVRGTVRERMENQVRALPFALVEAWSPGFRGAVLADSAGGYQLGGVPGGALRVRASHPGHEPVTLEVIVPAGTPLEVDLELRVRPVEVRALNVTAGVRVPEPGEREFGAAEARVAAAALEIGSGAVDAGLAEAVRAFAGNDPADPRDVLFMRGSTTDLKLVLLDGAPVYAPFHGAGLLRSFDPAVLGRAELHVGGAPARYDGGLTYILDLRTRRPARDGLHLSAALDLISASAALDAPLGARTSVLASARTLHGLAGAVLGASPYGYGDVLVGVEAEPGRDHRVRATGFWNRESVVLDLAGAGGPAADAVSVPGQAWWSNRAASMSWAGILGGFLLEASTAAASYAAALPLQPSAPRGGDGAAPLLASATTQRIRAGLDGARPGARGTLRAGLSLEVLDAAYDAAPLGAAGRASGVASASTAAGAYVDASRVLAPDVTLRGGMRLDRFSGDGAPRLAPRASLAWQVGPQAVVTVAAGRYHQTARASDAAVEHALGQVGVVPAAPRRLLPVATADHLVVSLDQTLGATVRLGLAAFWKAYRGLRADPAEEILSSGVDLRVQRRGERSTAWLGYGLTWYWAGNDLSGAASDFAGRQLLTAGLSGSLGSRFGAEVQLAYGAGLPYTSVPWRAATPAEAERTLDVTRTQLGHSPPLPGGPDEDFLRADAELHASFSTSWLGRNGSLRPYVRILNALARRDALFYAFQPWRSDTLTPLARRPLVPVFGLAWSF